MAIKTRIVKVMTHIASWYPQIIKKDTRTPFTVKSSGTPNSHVKSR